MALTKITSSVIGSNVIGSSQIANAAIESRHLAGSNIFSNISVNSANVGSFYSWFDSNANAYGYTANSKFSITNYFVNDIVVTVLVLEELLLIYYPHLILIY